MTQGTRYKVQGRASGHGSKIFTTGDENVLLELREHTPGRSLRDYKRKLFEITGTVASLSVICLWFLKEHPFCASMRVANPIPIAKFSAPNQDKFEAYMTAVGGIDPVKVKFADEKSLRGFTFFWSAEQSGSLHRIGSWKACASGLQDKIFYHWYLWH